MEIHSVCIALTCFLLANGPSLAQQDSITNAVKATRDLIDNSVNKQGRTEIPITIVEASQVEFEPPFTWTLPRTSLARIRVANRVSGDLVAEPAAYTLVIPAGLLVYQDSAQAIFVGAGQTLTTQATGYDTLWVASAPGISTDRTYTLSILGSTSTMRLTYLADPSSIRSRFTKDNGLSSGGRHHDAMGRRRGDKSSVSHRELFLQRNNLK